MENLGNSGDTGSSRAFFPQGDVDDVRAAYIANNFEDLTTVLRAILQRDKVGRRYIDLFKASARAAGKTEEEIEAAWNAICANEHGPWEGDR